MFGEKRAHASPQEHAGKRPQQARQRLAQRLSAVNQTLNRAGHLIRQRVFDLIKRDLVFVSLFIKFFLLFSSARQKLLTPQVKVRQGTALSNCKIVASQTLLLNPKHLAIKLKSCKEIWNSLPATPQR